MKSYRNLIIGGVARAGKSILAQRIAHELNISRIPGDSFVSAFQELYPEHGITHDDVHGRICHNVSEFFIRFWKTCHFDENFDFVFDSYHILPELLPLDRLGPDFAFLFLGYAEIAPADMLRRVRNFPNPNDWTTEMADDELLPMLAGLIGISRTIRDQCQRLGLTYVDVSADFIVAQDQAFAGALEQMKREPV